MAKTKIKKDSHGFYVRTDGNIFRPEPTPYSYRTHGVCKGQTAFKEGEAVKARHIPQTPYAKVSGEHTWEVWHSYGCYYDFDHDGKLKASDLCWTPEIKQPIQLSIDFSLDSQ
jgi:hypothetical protein